MCVQSVTVLRARAVMADKDELNFVVVPCPLDPGVMDYARRYFYGYARVGIDEALYVGYRHVARYSLPPLWYEKLPDALLKAEVNRIAEQDGSWCAQVDHDELWCGMDSERSLITQLGFQCVHRSDSDDVVERALLMSLETLGSDRAVYQSPACRIFGEKL